MNHFQIDAFGHFPPTLFQRACRAVGSRLPNSYLGRRVAGWIRSAVRRTARHPADVVVFKQRMRLHLGDNACERRLLITPQWFDPFELSMLSEAIRPSFHFIDLGANVGTYAIFVAIQNPSSRVLAIEPHPFLIPRLRENIALNRANVTVIPFAISDAPGVVTFTSGTSNLGISSIVDRNRRRGLSPQLAVRSRTLLDVVQSEGFERIDALKADIEGAEDLALIPFFAAASRALWPRMMIIEDNRRHWRMDCISSLVGRGYIVVREDANIVLKLADH